MNLNVTSEQNSSHITVDDIDTSSLLVDPRYTSQSQSNGSIGGEEGKPSTEKGKDAGKTQDFAFSKVSKRKKLLLLSMAFVNFCATTCFSLLAPFYPREALAKGASQTVIGFVFGIFEFVIFLSAPIFGNFITRIGSKFMFISGVMVCGSCAILFGVLDKSPDGDIFIVMCFLSRTIEALGCSAFITASFAIVSHEFPNHVTTVIGLLETFSGIGMMAGPAVGSALYVAGGYGLPFFVMGGVLILCGFTCSFIMPPISDSRTKTSKSIVNLLQSPLALITAFCICFGSFSLGFLDPVFSTHLEKLKISTMYIGLMFLISPGVYAFTAPLWGWIGDTKGCVKTLIVIGNLFTAVSLLIIGPSPLTPFIPFEIWTTVIGCATLGLFLGCALMPTFKTLFQGAMQLGFEDNFDTHGMVSGLFNSCFSLGAFLGPTVGGALVDKVGFAWSTTACSSLYIIASALMFGYGLVERFTDCLPKPPSQPGYERFVDEIAMTNLNGS